MTWQGRLIGAVVWLASGVSLHAGAGGVIVSEGVVVPSARVAEGPHGACYRPDMQRWEPCGPAKTWIALAWIGQAVDLASTEWALARGGRELNPLMQVRAVRWTVKPLLVGGVTWGLGRVPRSAANGLAQTVFWTGVVPGTLNIVTGMR